VAWKVRPQLNHHLSKTRSSAQTNGCQPLAQEYTTFGIKIREDLIQHLVKIRSRCVPESPNLDILKMVFSVWEWLGAPKSLSSFEAEAVQ
jgi:hypothetical protein